MARQFVEVKFRPWDKRAYTYHNDSDPVNVGAKVRVETRDGWQEVEVVGVSEVEPAFPTKAISVGEAAPAVPPPRKRRRDGSMRQQGSFLGDIAPPSIEGDEMPW